MRETDPPLTLTQPIYSMTAHTGTVHVGEWHSRMNSGFFWPVCGNISKSMTHAWVEFSALLSHPKLCGRCKQIVNNKTFLLDYAALFSIMAVNLLRQVGMQRSSVRLDEFQLSYNMAHNKTTWRFRDTEGHVSDSFFETLPETNGEEALRVAAKSMADTIAREILK